MELEAQRQAEQTSRLTLLIDLLQEEAGEGAPAPPADAAARWSEAAVRAFFTTGGVEPAPAAQPGQPGGGRLQEAPGGAAAGAAPPAVKAAQAALTAETYRRVALAHGIPLRAHGLFPPGDAVLAKIAADTAAGFQPFTKHLVGASGALEPVGTSWPVGEEAAKRGIDLRYFIATRAAVQPDGVGARLAAAVRYGDGAAIGANLWTQTHGGAIETAFDEATAELCKISVAALATTLEFSCVLKKAVPLHTSVRLDCVIESVTSGGLRLNTTGTMTTHDGMLLATCKAQLIDVGRLSRA
jgi:hypothetical protein